MKENHYLERWPQKKVKGLCVPVAAKMSSYTRRILCLVLLFEVRIAAQNAESFWGCDRNSSHIAGKGVAEFEERPQR